MSNLYFSIAKYWIYPGHCSNRMMKNVFLCHWSDLLVFFLCLFVNHNRWDGLLDIYSTQKFTCDHSKLQRNHKILTLSLEIEIGLTNWFLPFPAMWLGKSFSHVSLIKYRYSQSVSSKVIMNILSKKKLYSYDKC